MNDQDFQAIRDSIIFSVGNSPYFRARFIDGIFTPEPPCAERLKSKVIRVSSIQCAVSSWCDHGSVFTWNPDQQCWDEFDTSQNQVVCSWTNMDLVRAPIYYADGKQDTIWKAYFYQGKFIPHETCCQYLKSNVVRLNSGLCQVDNWCDHSTLFFFNQDTKDWDEFDINNQKIVISWKLLQ